MPIYDLKDVEGVVESDGAVRCIRCMDEIEDYWSKFDDQNEIILTTTYLESQDSLYICDYCRDNLS